jgi:hypothetical protein
LRKGADHKTSGLPTFPVNLFDGSWEELRWWGWEVET